MKKVIAGIGIVVGVALVGLSQIPLNVTPVNPQPVVRQNPITATASGVVSASNATPVIAMLGIGFDTGSILSSNHLVSIVGRQINTNGDWFVSAQFSAGTNISTTSGNLNLGRPKTR